MALLEIRALDVRFATHDGEVHAVKDAGFDVDEGECLGVVGESGSGKSQLFLAAMGLLAANGRVSGSVRYRGSELLGLSQRRLNAVRGAKITMVFQDPLTCLTPHMTIGAQIAEVVRTHLHLSRGEARRRAVDILEQVRIPDPTLRMGQYPHELSGGMRQRVMIAMAAVCGPELVIADEPTTALDVTVQAQILDLLRNLKAALKTAVVLISHDMGVIAGMADRVLVMRAGEIVERGPVDDVFARPQHTYTRTLLDAMPRLDQPSKAQPIAEGAADLLQVSNLSVHFGDNKPAVEGVDLFVRAGETLGIVGESGSGKSTLARAILRLIPKSDGHIVWLGREIGPRDDIRTLRKDLQIVFQDPLASLDPRRTIGQSIGEPLEALMPLLSRANKAARVEAMMRHVGLDPAWINRYPHEFSGGQNQRAGIARAMIVEPKLVICDEAVSALDVSIQAQIIELIQELQTQTGLSLIFISHDLAVVKKLAHRVMVLYRGRVVETGDCATLYSAPRHRYTQALLAAVPDPKLMRDRRTSGCASP